MQTYQEKNLGPEPLDRATHAALDQAEAEISRGKVLTLEQSNRNLKKRLAIWRKAQQKVLTD